MPPSPRNPVLSSLLLLTLVLVQAAPARAQALARPGWAGFGAPAQPWWQQAVLYRLDPARFQDSDGDGRGDLAGVAQRLDYLKSLGVDAVLLDGSLSPNSPSSPSGNLDDLGDLVRAASQRQMRVLLAIPPALQAQPPAQVVATVRAWLGAGAAGVSLLQPPAGTTEALNTPLYAAVAATLRSFPGDRILLADPGLSVILPVSAAPTGPHRPHRAGTAPGPNLLTTATLLPVQPPDPAALRQALGSLTEASAHTLLRFAADPATGAPDAGAAAVLLLASRGTALFDFGDEIGLDAYPAATASAPLPVMQWTPVNVQQAPVERPAPPPPSNPNVYGPYRPYVRPPSRALTGPAPAAPAATVDGNIPLPPPDPNTLPGFTSGTLPAAPTHGALVNAATEDRAPNSLLNAYRQLIALHHGNATLRGGGQAVLDRDEQRAVVVIRRAPPGSRAASDLVIAANLGDGPTTLRLDADLAHLGIRPGALRALFTWAPSALTGETTGALLLPPHAAFIGEIYRPRR